MTFIMLYFCFMILTINDENSGDNAPKKSLENTSISEGLSSLLIDHRQKEGLDLQGTLDRGLVKFCFCAEGSGTLAFHGGSYQLPLNQGHCLLFYNPLNELDLSVHLSAGTRLLFLFMEVTAMHKMFVESNDELAFINAENVNKKFYSDRPLSPSLLVALNQTFTAPVSGPVAKVYHQSKVLEILALFFNRQEGKDTEACPFLEDEENVEKIREAKSILLERMAEPPTIPELALEVGLNEYRLKEGFKNIYGTTVFKYLNDYRLESARQLLESGKVKVNEAAYHIGYTNPSHFIAAFRKKYGVTPKKYLQKQ